MAEIWSMPSGCAAAACSNRWRSSVERPFGDGEQQVFLVLEVHVEQRAGEAGAPCHLVHGDGIPALLGVQGLGRLDDLEPAAFLFLFAAFGKVGHGGMLGLH